MYFMVDLKSTYRVLLTMKLQSGLCAAGPGAFLQRNSWPFPLPFYHIFYRPLQVGYTSCVYSRVFTTSNGLVMTPANPPANPAQKKYQITECCLSQGRKYVFRFSLKNITEVAKGIFIATVIG